MNYTKFMKALAVFCLSALMFAGCKKQSTFDFATMPCSGTVNGVLSYSEGCSPKGSQGYNDLTKPAADKNVEILVNNTNYKSGSSGYTLYTTVRTDEQGKFSAEIPVPLNSTVTVMIRPEGFSGVFNKAVTENNQVKQVQQNVYFYASPATVNISAYQSVNQNITYVASEEAESVKTYNEVAKIEIKIGKKIEKYIGATTELDGYNKKVLKTQPSRQTFWRGAPDVNLFLTIIDLNDNYRTMEICGKTDASGICKIEVPVNEFPASIKISQITAMPFQETYKYYKMIAKLWDSYDLAANWSSMYSINNPPYTNDYEATNVEGYYSQVSTLSSSYNTKRFNVKEETWTVEPLKAMAFTPYDNSIYITTSGNDWEDEEN